MRYAFAQCVAELRERCLEVLTQLPATVYVQSHVQLHAPARLPAH